MASSSPCPPPSPRLAHLLLVLVAAVVLLGRGGEARQPAPLHGVVRSMAFDEGYTQLFGSGNLALRRDGKRVHLALDESTGECCPALAAALMRFRRNMRVRIALLCFTNGSLLSSVQSPKAEGGRFCDFANFRVLFTRTCLRLPLPCAGSGFASQDLFLHGFFSAAVKLPADYAAGVVVAFYLSNADAYEKTHDELDFEFLGNVRGREWRVQTNVYGNGSTGAGREERYDLPFDPTDDFHHYSILWTQHRIM
ncbi:hypothetical protein VPH35_090111 [Triticum aestivum]